MRAYAPSDKLGVASKDGLWATIPAPPQPPEPSPYYPSITSIASPASYKRILKECRGPEVRPAE